MYCPLCKNSDVSIVYKKADTFFTDGRTAIDLEVSLCSSCGFAFQSSAYGDEYDKKVANLYSDYRMSENFTFPRRDKKSLESLDFICSNVSVSKDYNVLEIGSDRGDFLFMLKEISGANVIGVEPNTKQIAKVSTVKGSFSKELFSSKFDLIILKHTLEHITYPADFLKEVFSLLADGGYIYIEVPSLDVCMKHFLDDFTPEHVSYFSQNVLLNMLNEYEITAVDNSHFLRVIAQNIVPKNKTASNIDDISNIKNFFGEMALRKESLEKAIINHANSGNIVIFYGVGLYFRILFGSLNGHINKQNCFFYDDGFDGEVESFFGLQKVDFKKINKNVIAVFCSNDYMVQNAMNERLGLVLKEYQPIYFCATTNVK